MTLKVSQKRTCNMFLRLSKPCSTVKFTTVDLENRINWIIRLDSSSKTGWALDKNRMTLNNSYQMRMSLDAPNKSWWVTSSNRIQRQRCQLDSPTLNRAIRSRVRQPSTKTWPFRIASKNRLTARTHLWSQLTWMTKLWNEARYPKSQASLSI